MASIRSAALSAARLLSRGLLVTLVALADCSRGNVTDTNIAPKAPALQNRSPHVSATPIGDAGTADSALDAALPEPEGAPPAPALSGGGRRSIAGKYGLVVSVEAEATRAGVLILEQGGNAVDAAVAVAYALSVTQPSAGNIGGGGFMLVRLAGQPTVAIDFREVMPRALTRDKFDRMLERGAAGYASAGVPGSVAGLNLALSRFGHLPRKAVMQPAIELAQRGHVVDSREANTLRWSWPALVRDAGARADFADKSGKQPLKAGARLKRIDLGETLRRIADFGDDGFYKGPVAGALVSAAERGGGVLSLEDLASYRAIVREPLRFTYRGLEVEVMPPPSAGGVVLVQTLLMLRELGAYRFERFSARALHLFIEASRRAQAERRFAVVDPDSLSPVAGARRRADFTNPHYLLDKPPSIDLARATPSERVHPLFAAALRELEHTTHFAVVDAAGNVVSCTTTLSASFGAKVLAPGTGVILNNSVASFARYGENLPVGGKRTTSSMAPTLVLKGGKPVLVLGTPGGDTIPSTIAQVFRNLVDYGMPLEDAVDAPRIHHGFAPDVVRLERPRPLPKASARSLERLGHKLKPLWLDIGDANSIVIGADGAWAYADPREGGLALAARAPASP